MIIGIASADHLRADRSPDGVEKWGGAGWARVGQYLPFYEAAGHTVHRGVMWKKPDGLYIEDSEHVHTRPDVIVMQRLMVKGVAEAIDFGRTHDQVVINDVDDWYWGLDEHNAAFYASHPKYNLTENTNFYREVIRSSSIITVSTAFLADRMRDMAPRAEVIHIPNYIDTDRFTPVTQHAYPTLGWAGSTEHRSRDLETLRGVVNPFVVSGKYKLHHGGATWTDNGVIVDGFAEKIGVDPALVTSAPRTMAEDYPRLLTFDVGIVPLRDIPFNRAKSYIKGLEYAAAGIPFIAQALPEYQTLFDQWGDGFIVAKKPKDWIKALNRFTDYGYRLEMQRVCLDKVQQHRVEFGATRWIELLEGLVKQ